GCDARGDPDPIRLVRGTCRALHLAPPRPGGSGMQQHTVELSDGSVVWYQRGGSGPIIVDIHGTGFGYRNFSMLTPHMVDAFEVIDFDLPGYGQSTANGPIGVPEWAAYAAEFIRTVVGEPVHIHGTSMGAMVATILAAEHPDVVKDLVLSCCLF